MNASRLLLIGVAVVPVITVRAASPGGTRQAEIRRALSAAPPAIAARATVEKRGKRGHWIVLRRGDNGWTCIPRSNGDPEPLPACFDANGMAFILTFDEGTSPDPDKPGLSYMLRGGSGWSNVAPNASRLPPGHKDYIHIPPHIMILDARLANESGLPLHETDPDTHTPFVMFGGTKHAILIILALTARGRTLVPTLAALAEQNEAEFFDHLSIKERSTIERVLRDLVRIRGLKSIPVE